MTDEERIAKAKRLEMDGDLEGARELLKRVSRKEPPKGNGPKPVTTKSHGRKKSSDSSSEETT